MTKKTKELDAVALAHQAVEAKQAEIKAAEARLQQLRSELAAAYHAVEDAHDVEDAKLPQCLMVTVRWRSGEAEEPRSVAIVRQTRDNQLVARRRGIEHRFKWDQHRECYVQVEKTRFFMDDARELRDLPAEFLPRRTVIG
ncbi:MAG: hypothetical protein DI587_14880 [Variovorax paradoxus]|nr:MAG: hypothetical protein DI583_14880 [Variovorax paradoxus]PZQ09689.1 MAG: hypothetical protein DI587_14880 [Variovorax paradoxus]